MWVSSEDEGGVFSEDGEHSVKKIVLCSFTNCKCSPLLQGFLHEEVLCKVTTTCHSSLDVSFLCQD